MIKELILSTLLSSTIAILGVSTNRSSNVLRDTFTINDIKPVTGVNPSVYADYDTYYDYGLNKNITFAYNEHCYYYNSGSNLKNTHISFVVNNADDYSYYDDVYNLFDLPVLHYVDSVDYYMFCPFQFWIGDGFDDLSLESAPCCIWFGLHVQDNYTMDFCYTYSLYNYDTWYSSYSGLFNYDMLITISPISLDGDVMFLDEQYSSRFVFYDKTSPNVYYRGTPITITSNNIYGARAFVVDVTINDKMDGDTYDEAYSSGYNTGKNDGIEIGKNIGNTLASLFLTIGDIPFAMLHSIFNFDVFGISLFLGVIGLFSITIVIFVVKKVV